MSLTVEVKKLSQDVSIEDGAAFTQNFVLFELPNGGIVKAAIDDSAAEALLDALVRGASSDKVPQQDSGYEPPIPRRPAPRRAAPTLEEPELPPEFEETQLPDGSKAHVFGGGAEGDTAEREAVSPPTKPQGKVRAVGKDAFGYPVMRATGDVRDPGEISAGVGAPGSDEDGVASV